MTEREAAEQGENKKRDSAALRDLLLWRKTFGELLCDKIRRDRRANKEETNCSGLVEL